MSLKLYRDQPFDNTTEVSLLDLFVGDASETSFDLVNKTGVELAGTIQADTTQYLKYTGGFTVVGDTFTLSSAPGMDAVIIAPGFSALVTSAFDVDPVPGVTDPLIQEVSFYIGNGEEIHLEYYEGVDENGISLQFVNLIELAGLADSDWLQLSAATADLAGDPVAYQDPDEAILTNPIKAAATVDDAVLATATTINVISTDTWYTGDYIKINPGEATEEVVKLVGQSGDPITQMTTTALNYNHDPGEPIFACARKFWLKLTAPEGEVTVPANFVNVSLRIQGIVKSRF